MVTQFHSVPRQLSREMELVQNLSSKGKEPKMAGLTSILDEGYWHLRIAIES